MHAQVAVVHVDDAARLVAAEQAQRHGVAGGLQRRFAQSRGALHQGQPARQQHQAHRGQERCGQHGSALAAVVGERGVLGVGHQQLEAEVAQRHVGADACPAVRGGAGAGEDTVVVAQLAARRGELVEQVAADEARRVGLARQGQAVAAQQDQGRGGLRREQAVHVAQPLQVHHGHDHVVVLQRARQAHQQRQAGVVVVGAAAQLQRQAQHEAVGDRACRLRERGGALDAGAVVFGTGLQAADLAGARDEHHVDQPARAVAHTLCELRQRRVGQRLFTAAAVEPQVDQAHRALGLAQHGLGLHRHGAHGRRQLAALLGAQLAGLLDDVPGDGGPQRQDDQAEGQRRGQHQRAVTPAPAACEAVLRGAVWRVAGRSRGAHQRVGAAKIVRPAHPGERLRRGEKTGVLLAQQLLLHLAHRVARAARPAR